MAGPEAILDRGLVGALLAAVLALASVVAFLYRELAESRRQLKASEEARLKEANEGREWALDLQAKNLELAGKLTIWLETQQPRRGPFR